jgi:hypothetical protein
MVKAVIVINSQLSDAKLETSMIKSDSEMMSRVALRIDFAKFLIIKFKDTDTEIDPDVEWDLFEKTK